MAAIHDIDNFLENDIDGIYSELRSLGLTNETIRDFMSSVANDGIDLTIDNASKIRNALNVLLRGLSHVKESKSPIDIVLENFSLKEAVNEALGNLPPPGTDKKAKLADLKQDLIYAERQAEQGPEKSRHIFADKANKIKAELAKLEGEKVDLGSVFSKDYELAKQATKERHEHPEDYNEALEHNKELKHGYRSIEELAKLKNMSVDDLKKKYKVEQGTDEDGKAVFVAHKKITESIDFKKLFKL